MLEKTHLLVLITLLALPLSSQTIAEKKAGLKKGSTDLDPKTELVLTKVNDDLINTKERLNDLYADVARLQKLNAPEDSYKELLDLINKQKMRLRNLNDEWITLAKDTAKTDIYSLWHQPETTIGQLVIDFGAGDHIYVMSPELSEMKISVNSNLSIPRAEWESILELVLSQNGIGIRETNSYLRELYLTENGPSTIKTITNKTEDLHFLPTNERIAFMLTPEPSDVRRVYAFLNKFINPKSTTLQQFGRDILIVSQVGEIQDLLKLYDFIATSKTQKEYKLVSLSKIKAAEMSKVISAMFDQMASEPLIIEENQKTIPPQNSNEINGLKIIVLDSLSQAIFLVGTKEEIEQAEEMIHRVESSICGGREKVIHWYTAHYTPAADLADTMQKIYVAMVREKIGRPQTSNMPPQQNETININEAPNFLGPESVLNNSYFLNGEAVINPLPISPGLALEEENLPKQNRSTPNFIVDEKSGSIVMVVEKELLPKMIEVVAKLDVPKKMVQIDVLLFERVVTDETDFGLNLLKVGAAASNTRATSLTFNDPTVSLIRGVTEFLISRPKCNGFPAYDLSYRFLLTQDELNLNANPSIVTLNQTPARILIQDEISISTGVNFIATSANLPVPNASFARAQYGITIDVTPTIHLTTPDNNFGDGVDYITLASDIYFDTIDRTSLTPDRPPVNRRNIKNEVMIPDGQTIIIGGLLQRESADHREAVPYLGELPGFGKLFSYTRLSDRTKEMLIFLTPKIIYDPCEDIERLKMERLSERPGDLPCFMARMNESRERQIHQALRQTMNIICGPRPACYYPTQIGCVPAPCASRNCAYREYDGRE